MKRQAWFEIMHRPDLLPCDLPPYWFRIRAANGRILAHSEIYTRKAAALRACRAINPKLRIVEK